MTPQEKAKELIDRYLCIDDNIDLFCDECGMSEDASKLCALIAVDEIIKVWINNFKELKEDETMEIKHSLNEIMALSHSIKYWNEVKQEIEKL